MHQNAFLGFALVAIKLIVATKRPNLYKSNRCEEKIALKLRFNEKFCRIQDAMPNAVCSNFIVVFVLFMINCQELRLRQADELRLLFYFCILISLSAFI